MLRQSLQQAFIILEQVSFIEYHVVPHPLCFVQQNFLSYKVVLRGLFLEQPC